MGNVPFGTAHAPSVGSTDVERRHFWSTLKKTRLKIPEECPDCNGSGKRWLENNAVCWRAPRRMRESCSMPALFVRVLGVSGHKRVHQVGGKRIDFIASSGETASSAETAMTIQVRVVKNIHERVFRSCSGLHQVRSRAQLQGLIQEMSASAVQSQKRVGRGRIYTYNVPSLPQTSMGVDHHGTDRRQNSSCSSSTSGRTSARGVANRCRVKVKPRLQER